MLIEIINNFKFLAIETESQVKLTYGLMNNLNIDLIEKIVSKDDYIDNLKTVVENSCFGRIHGTDFVDGKEINLIRSIHVISVNLERIADFCVNITRQMRYLTTPSFIHRFEYKNMFSEIQKGLSGIIPVFEKKDLPGALEICRTEANLDQMYKENFDRIMAELREGNYIENLITAIFIFRYLERIGDSLLNIGEALIFSIMGERIKIEHVDALEKTLSASGLDEKLTDIYFSGIWGSRSGCRIKKIGGKDSNNRRTQKIFKEGNLNKIRKERDSIQRWEEIMPGLPPKLYGFSEHQNIGSLLVEYLTGCTMDEIILTSDNEILLNAVFVLESTINDIWTTTQTKKSFQTDYMKQLKSRLDEILRIHPNFFQNEKQVGNLTIPSTEQLIRKCSEIEMQHPAPFTVFIHGDFNTNNIVYNHEEQKVRYIDLYRSKHADYIQDASVFLISNFRFPVFDSKIRKRIDFVISHFFDIFSNFARQHQDQTFHIRMALALARSFYTSTRFELNYSFAREMYLRAHFILEQIASYTGDYQQFRFPRDILLY